MVEKFISYYIKNKSISINKMVVGTLVLVLTNANKTLIIVRMF